MNGLFKVPSKWNMDVVGWAYIGLMIAGSVAGLIAEEATWLSLIAVIALAVMEEKRMKKQGFLAWPSSWWVLLLPVYLWKRLTALRLPKHLFWIWIAVAVALSAMEVAFDNAGMEKAAMSQLTQAIHQSGMSDVDCVKVKLGEEFAPDNYRAKATFSDGSESDILIQKKDGKVSVRF